MKLLLTLLLLPISVQASKSFFPNSFKSQFKEITISKISGKEKTSVGELEYLYPSNLKLVTEDLVFVTNGKKSFFYRPPFMEGEKGELKIHDGKKSDSTRFFDVLKNGLTNNKFYNVIKNKDHYELSFSPKASEKYGIDKIQLFFHDVAMKKPTFEKTNKMSIVYKDKRAVDFMFANFKRDAKLSSENFVFEAPKNTNTIQVR